MQVVETDHAEPKELVPSPNYRVNFWDRRSLKTSWNLDAYVLFEVAGVNEVLQWASENANGRPYEVFVEVEDEDAHELEVPRITSIVRLLGEDPNDPNSKYNV